MLQFAEEFSGALRIQVLDTSAATRCDNPEGFAVGVQEPWDKGAAPRFQQAENPDLVVKAPGGVRTAKFLVDASVIADADGGPQSILYVLHSKGRILPISKFSLKSARNSIVGPGRK